ncbi:hypothetical protein [Rugosimonospora africana]|uniref:Uncharacterized protein n=1 Tax=Rugosimonospora africana TaxID=556532 RepID=A0A8J3VS70_9ACTN|nr:hypothetical protein [Rugosimonospora africana]GIH16256.1 hypothetical protein Raf01_44280 [Rugosimonospora africana]
MANTLPAHVQIGDAADLLGVPNSAVVYLVRFGKLTGETSPESHLPGLLYTVYGASLETYISGLVDAAGIS